MHASSWTEPRRCIAGMSCLNRRRTLKPPIGIYAGCGSATRGAGVVVGARVCGESLRPAPRREAAFALPRGQNSALTTVIAPHADERSMDLIGWLVEGLDVDMNDGAVVHVPRQAHECAINRHLAPIGNEGARKRCAKGNL